MDMLKILTEKNVGGIDLFLRSLLGSLAITLLALDAVPDSMRVLTGIVAFVGLFSGLTKHCTPYSLLGINTRRKREKKPVKKMVI